MPTLISSALAPFALVAAAPLPQPMLAAPTVDAARPESVVAALQADGYKALLGKDNSGDPKIDSAAEGANFHIYFYGCENHLKCRSVQLYVSYEMKDLKEKPTADKMNEWNRNNRFSTAYVDKDGYPTIQWDIVLEEGMSAELFDGFVDRWTGAMSDFQKFIGWS